MEVWGSWPRQVDQEGTRTGCRLGLVRVVSVFGLSLFFVDIPNERRSVKPSQIGWFDLAQEQQNDWRQYGRKSAAVRDDCVVPNGVCRMP